MTTLKETNSKLYFTDDDSLTKQVLYVADLPTYYYSEGELPSKFYRLIDIPDSNFTNKLGSNDNPIAVPRGRKYPYSLIPGGPTTMGGDNAFEISGRNFFTNPSVSNPITGAIGELIQFSIVYSTYHQPNMNPFIPGGYRDDDIITTNSNFPTYIYGKVAGIDGSGEQFRTHQSVTQAFETITAYPIVINMWLISGYLDDYTERRTPPVHMQIYAKNRLIFDGVVEKVVIAPKSFMSETEYDSDPDKDIFGRRPQIEVRATRMPLIW